MGWKNFGLEKFAKIKRDYGYHGNISGNHGNQIHFTIPSLFGPQSVKRDK